MDHRRTPERPARLQVLVATRSVAIGSALAQLLSDHATLDITVVPEDALAVHPDGLGAPDLVLLDIEPWPGTLLALARRLKSLTSQPHVLALVHGLNPQIQRHCRSAGVDEVFDRTSGLAHLLAAVAQRAGRPVPASAATRAPA